MIATSRTWAGSIRSWSASSSTTAHINKTHTLHSPLIHEFTASSNLALILRITALPCWWSQRPRFLLAVSIGDVSAQLAIFKLNCSREHSPECAQPTYKLPFFNAY
jgi:hypothetical protein